MRFWQPPIRFAMPFLILLSIAMLFIPSVRGYLAPYPAVMSVTFAFITSLASRRSGANKTERNIWFALTVVAGAFTICSVVANEQRRALDTKAAQNRYEQNKKASDLQHTIDVAQQRELFRDVTATLREMASAPLSSFKRKVLTLAVNILDFHADRTAPRAIPMAGAAIPLSPEQQADFDSETIRQYKNRFAGPVADVVAELKGYKLSDPDLDEMALRDPELFTIRQVGEGLRRLGNRLP